MRIVRDVFYDALIHSEYTRYKPTYSLVCHDWKEWLHDHHIFYQFNHFDFVNKTTAVVKLLHLLRKHTHLLDAFVDMKTLETFHQFHQIKISVASKLQVFKSLLQKLFYK